MRACIELDSSLTSVSVNSIKQCEMICDVLRNCHTLTSVKFDQIASLDSRLQQTIQNMCKMNIRLGNVMISLPELYNWIKTRRMNEETKDNENKVNIQGLKSELKLMMNQDVLDLSCLKLTDQDVEWLLLQVVTPFPTEFVNVKNIDLSCNLLTGSRHLECLFSQVIPHNQGLTSINLSYNEIEDEGAQLLSQFIQQNHTLTSINLSFNKMSDEGLTRLAVGVILRMKSQLQITLELNAKDKFDEEFQQRLCVMKMLMPSVSVGRPTNPLGRFFNNGLFDRHLLNMIFTYSSKYKNETTHKNRKGSETEFNQMKKAK